MAANRTAELVRALAEEPVAERGCEIWSVEYVKEAGQWYLRVFIDKYPGGVTIDDCESISRALGEKLDEADPIEDSYILEVGSPGVERTLTLPSHFERYIGETVVVKLYKARDGAKEYTGTLTGYDGGTVHISAADGPVSFGKDETAKIKLKVF